MTIAMDGWTTDNFGVIIAMQRVPLEYRRWKCAMQCSTNDEYEEVGGKPAVTTCYSF